MTAFFFKYYAGPKLQRAKRSSVTRKITKNGNLAIRKIYSIDAIIIFELYCYLYQNELPHKICTNVALESIMDRLFARTRLCRNHVTATRTIP